MKKLACFMVSCLLLICAASPASADNGDTTVYITRTGSKYHTSSCQHLAASCIEISLADAVAGGYTPCRVCYPPLLSADEPAPTPTPKPTYHPLPTVNAAASVYAPAIVTVSPTASPAPSKSSSSDSGFKSAAIVMQIVLAGAAVVFHKKRIAKVREEECTRLTNLYEQKLKSIYTQLYGGKDLLVLTKAPPNAFVDEHGLPGIRSRSSDWGNNYTVYVNRSSGIYHTPDCRYGKLCSVKNVSQLTPVNRACGICKPVRPDLSWYYEYKKIKAIKEKYNID